MRLIFGGHWALPPDGWSVVPERDQDIRRPLRFSDSSVEAIFTEHVIEHVSLLDAVFFFRECFRILQPGGVMRTVTPSVDALQRFGLSDQDGPTLIEQRETAYLAESVVPRYPAEDALLQSLSVNLTDPAVGKAFMFDSLLKLHGHQFLWSEALLCDVLVGLGYGPVEFFERPGDGRCALEHGIRGTPEHIVRGGLPPHANPYYVQFDPESLFCVAEKFK